MTENVETAAGGTGPAAVDPGVPKSRPAMNKKDIEDIYPLTPLQQGMLSHSLQDPDGSHYVEQVTVRLTGRLDEEVFLRAWQAVLDGNGALRTAFVWEKVPRPLQVVFREVALPTHREDWRGMTPGEQQARLDAYTRADRVRGFDLRLPPLARVALFRMGEEETAAVSTLYHGIVDGWSLPILWLDALTWYEEAVRGRVHRPARRRPFRDYVHWLLKQDLGQAEAFWRRALGGLAGPTVVDVGAPPAPDEVPAEGEPTHHLAELALSPAATAALQERAREHRLTLNTVLQGAWALLLARLSGNDDVVFGTIVSGRPAELEGVEEMVGLFLNTIPVRVRVDAAASLAEWLGRIQEEQFEARHYEYAPLVEVQAWSGVPHDRPLFDSLLVYENYPQLTAGPEEEVPEGNLRVRSTNAPHSTAYPLVMVSSTHVGVTRLYLTYDARRYPRAFAEGAVRQMRALLEAFAADPRATVGRVETLGAEERALLLGAWGRNERPWPRGRTVASLFAGQAAATPDAVAVEAADGGTWTYRELDARASRLAGRLRGLGVGPGSRVGLSVERSPEMVAALVAILKAGAAYVPLDPSYPAERLAFMLEDAGVSALVAGDRVPAPLASFRGPVLCLARDADAADAAVAAEPAEACGEELAYVIYTSGSTGRPKGVAVPNRAVARLVKGADWADFGADQVFLQLAPVAFDASTLELWGPLLNGGRLVLFPPEAPSLEELGEFVRTRGITTLWLTAGLFHQVVDAQLESLGGLRQLLAGGDVLSPAHVRRVAERFPALRLVNGYGPTENTTFTCCHTVRPQDLGRASVPIGRPVANTHVLVLDPYGHPCPVGVPGELLAGGEGLAHGYLNRPALSAERFVPDPFSERPGARLYRTGDRVRWREDGTLEFLGRLDEQVKVRGFRIEPGEVEAALLEHPGVEQACVVAREDASGDRRLVGYLVHADGVELLPEEVRAHLAGRLPEHMVPSAFVVLHALPLTANGKVDRRALPEPGAQEAAGYVAPRNPTEAALAEVWAEVLGLDRVGVHDNFFHVGGHSLRATQAISRMREALGGEALPMRALFEHPTIARLAARFGPDAADGGEAAEADASARTAERPIVPVARGGEEIPLSFAQERLWFLDRMEPGNTTYNVAVALRMRGALDAAALRRTLEEVVRRHEALRTVFATGSAGRPVQVILPAGPFPLPLEDLSAAEDAEAAMRRRVDEESNRPFDLEAGPLFRAGLLRLRSEEHVLWLAIHHAVSDGWSMGVLVREMTELYAAFAAGRPSPLPGLEVQYADYAVWQRAHVTGEALEAQVRWWKERLAGAPALLELPTDRPRPPVQSYRGAMHYFQLPPETLAAAGETARREGATLFMVLLAAWNALLLRYAGQEDVVVGTPVAGRTRPEAEPLIGFFVNTLAVRADLSGDPAFREVVARVKEAALGAFAHQDVPFERLVEEVQPGRSLSHTPLFQVMFALQNAPMGDLRLGETELSMVEADVHAAKFDLSVSLTESGGALFGSVEYATDLFDAATVGRMMAHFATLAADAFAHPERPVGRLEVLGAEERRDVLERWNATERAYPRAGQRIHDLFEAQAAAAPDAVAVVHGERETTYAELNAAADRLARRLRALGVGPDVPVGVCAERDTAMVTALLAVLKAGGAYVPIDPQYPAGRIAYMLEDAGAPVLLAHAALEDRLPRTGATVVRLDADAAEPADPEAANPGVAVDPANLAYVIYTSGSTGRPKGVEIEHRSTVAFLHWMREQVSDEERRAVLGSTSVSFDVSVAEIFGTLCWGGTLVLVENALSLAEVRREVTLATMVPGAAAELLRMGAIPDSVTTFNLAGEALPPALARGLYETGTTRRVVNLYGPTEDTTYSTVHEVEPGASRVPIGRPVPNSRAYVLDARLLPAPVGVPGELYLAGEGLARGYRGRAALTAERFLPCPFGAPGERMYRVGDRARWLADGTLEYLGRADHQVKVRGFRIELGEIEAVLAQHPEVSEAVAVVREDAPGDRRVAAYVVPAAGAAADAAALRAHLRAHLPEYMLPSALVALEALPLTPNGKIDRRALPAPDTAPAGARSRPRTPTEEVLAAVWAEVLGVAEVGGNESFFDLGGHSLLATRVMSRVEELFGAGLPLRAIFEAPTVAELAARVDAARREAAPPVPPIVPVPRGVAPLPLSFAQQRLWFMDRMDGTAAAYNLPLALRVRGALDVAALERALAEVVRRHEVLRTTFELADGRPVQRIAAAGQAVLPMVDLSALLPEEAREAEMRRLVDEDAATPFDLERGPVFRAKLARLEAEHHVLLLNLHHVAGDGWSTAVLSGELGALYTAFAAGEPSPLPELPVQYADYAVWQRAWLSGAELERQTGFWKRHLEGAPSSIDLPIDRPRPPVQTFRGAMLEFDLPRPAEAALTALGRREGATAFMTLLAVFEALLARWSGQADLVVGTPIAGRGRPETAGLIGFFVNTLALRADLTDDPSFRVLVGRVRETLLEAHAHQDLPFEKLVEELRVERSLSHSPLFQVMFTLHNTALGGLDQPGLEWSEVRSPIEAAKYDLSLTVIETPDGSRGALEYNTDLFGAATMERMAAHFVRLAEAAAADPDRPVSRLAVLPDDERDRVLRAWNDTARDYGRVPLVTEAVTAWARRRPGAMAVEREGRGLAWAELEAAANRVAHRLRRMGVGPEVRVGLCLERTPEMIAAMLGILKAGGTYVPLDPTYPADRLALLLEDSGARVLVTTSALRDRLPADASAAPLLLDAEAEAVAAESAEPPAVAIDALNAAYCIYTSGSTGRPKGVLVTHGSLAGYARAMEELYSLTPDDRSLQFSSVSFDISVEEIFATLFAGATLVLRTDEMVATPADFLRLLGEWRLSVASLPTAFWHAVAAEVEAAGLAVPPSLRVMIIGGERALPERAAAWQRAAAGRTALVNSYGPTETTVASIAAVLPADAGADGRDLPIGRPLPDERAYVLDDALLPCPVGVPGELFVGGAGVARGYLERPGLTAERFVPDPFAEEPGARMYRTGDRARWRPDGQVAFMQRRDDQVKVRGFRVEPGEVEAALREHAAVRDAVVVARTDMVPGEKRLAAYLVGREGAEIDAAALRASLRDRLPDYMVPSALVVLEALPMTPGGKVDRRALPVPAGADGAPAGPVALEGEVEETVAAVWREVLGVEQVGAGDNFFDLGGHSILLARVQGRLKEALGTEVGMVTLFRFPTVRSLAAALAGDGGDQGEQTTQRGRDRADTRRASRARRREAIRSEGD